MKVIRFYKTKQGQIEAVVKDSDSGMWACFVQDVDFELVELFHDGHDVFEEHTSYAQWIDEALELLYSYVLNYRLVNAA